MSTSEIKSEQIDFINSTIKEIESVRPVLDVMIRIKKLMEPEPDASIRDYHASASADIALSLKWCDSSEETSDEWTREYCLKKAMEARKRARTWLDMLDEQLSPY